MFKSTALELADLAEPNGTVHVQRERLVARLALPRRTVDHHIQRLIEFGWLKRIRRPIVNGPNAGPAVFALAIPFDDMPPVASHQDGDDMQPTTDETPVITCKLVASSYRQGEQGERVALEEDAAGETTSTAAAAVDPAGIQQRHNEDEVMHAARVLEAFGMLHADHNMRLVSDVHLAA